MFRKTDITVSSEILCTFTESYHRFRNTFQLKMIHWLVLQYVKSMLQYTFLYKQLGSGLSPQSCLFFKVFGAESCLAVA